MGDIDTTKPSSDVKHYRLVTLASGLEVLLVDNSAVSGAASSPAEVHADSRKAAAAMCVNVGSFADPLEAQGLAHFLEHMLFMGIDSDKYPSSENLYDSFISSHGGSCNAMTDGEFTVYQFDVTVEHFAEALDIFAHCFKCPLLSTSAADREINAIESEFNLAKVSDGARLQQLLCDAAVDGHVLRKFSWGNLESLATIPQANHVDIHAVLRALYRKHYLPQHMKLVVIAPKPLDDMEKDVLACFDGWAPPPPPPEAAAAAGAFIAAAASSSSSSSDGAAATGKTSSKSRRTASSQHSPHPHGAVPPLPAQEDCLLPYLDVNPFQRPPSKKKHDVGALGALTRVVPVKRTHKLLMTWALPSMIRTYRSKPAGYVSHLLGHEGAGSLLSALKAAGLATGVSAGTSSQNVESNSMFSAFTVSVSLTVKGLANWVAVAEKIFEYVSLLRRTGPQRWIHDEIQRVSEMEYHYADEEDEADFVERLAIEMAPCYGRDRRDLLTAPFLLWDYDPEAIAAVVNKLTPAGCMFSLLSSAFREKKGAGEDDDEEDDDDEDDDDDDDDDEDDDDEDDDEDDEDEEEDGGADAAGEEDLSPERLASLYCGAPKWRALCALPTAPATGTKRREPTTERHFGTVHWRDAVPAQLLQAWADAAPGADLALPPPNPFIPQHLSFLTDQASAEPFPAPTATVNEDGLTVWHLVDGRFPLPKAQIWGQFVSPLPQQSATHAALHDLLVKCLADSTTEMLYMASMAELNCDIVGMYNALALKVYGFSDKASLLMQQIAGTVFQPSLPYLNAEIVDRQAEVLMRVYNNACLKASEAASTGRLLSLVPSRFPSEDKHAALVATATEPGGLLAAMRSYATSFLGDGLCVDVLAHGNVPAADAKSLSDALKACVGGFRAAAALVGAANRPAEVVLLPAGRPLQLHVAPRNPAETNVAVETYYQVGPFAGDVETLTLLDLLEQCLSEPFFDQLRTQQQLGYSVSCGVRQTYGMMGFCFQVVSSAHPVPHVQAAVTAFVDRIAVLLTDLPVDELTNHINSLVSDKSKPDTSLHDAASVFWDQITGEAPIDFLQRQRQVEYLRGRDVEAVRRALLALVARYLLDAATCRVLLVQASLEASFRTAELGSAEPTLGSAVVCRTAQDVHAQGTQVVMKR